MATNHVYCSIGILQSQEPLQVLYCIDAGELHEKGKLKVRYKSIISEQICTFHTGYESTVANHYKTNQLINIAAICTVKQ